MESIIIKADSRGYADHGWLKARHSFSFANYHDRNRMNFGLLRVLNDDIVGPGAGFGKHPHQNMEIVTIPLKGQLAHEDSTGGKGVISPGEVQIMSAGTGVYHSEFNHSKTDIVNLLQIWVFPRLENIAPRYDQKNFEPELKHNKFLTVVSPEKDKGSLWINQDAWFNLADLDKDTELSYNLNLKGNGIYLFVMEGSVTVNEVNLERRDAAGIWNTDELKIKALEQASILVIEVPMQ